MRLDEAEAVVDASGVAERLEAALPVGVRPRQLSVRTLVLGIVVALGDGRPAHLTRVHAALVSLAPSDRRRLGVVVEWKCGPHVLTYRQIERTFSLVTRVLRKAEPDGTPAAALQEMVDSLSEASVSDTYKEASSSYAVDWTDLETFGRPVANNETGGADPDASWGHRRGNGPGQHDEVFFGYYLSCLTMVKNEAAPAVPELCRGLTVTSCHVDPVPAVVPVIGHLVARGAPLRDVLSDSGYAHRRAEHWALPLRALGAELIMDLHPHDRGIRGTHQGAVSFNGNLYCPSTPPALLTLEPLARATTSEEISAHDRLSAELARYKLGRISDDDADGYHRVMCPAAMGKIRCPLRPKSMHLAPERPEVLSAPEHPPACCVQQMWALRDSNPRPAGCKPAALTN